MESLKMEERLWEYIDGYCNDEERDRINLLLHSSAIWKGKYDELLEVSRLLHHAELEQPSMRFVLNVMEEITRHHIAPATKTYINKKVIYGIGGFLITMVAGLLIYFIAQLNWTGETNASVIGENFNRIGWTGIFNTSYFNVFLMVNIVLGLMLLDRYLETKKEELKNERPTHR